MTASIESGVTAVAPVGVGVVGDEDEQAIEALTSSASPTVLMAPPHVRTLGTERRGVHMACDLTYEAVPNCLLLISKPLGAKMKEEPPRHLTTMCIGGDTF